MTKIAEWRKAAAAALLGTASWGVVAQVDGIDPVEWWGLFGVIATAAVVWLVPNSEDETVDRGRTDVITALVIVFLILVIGRLVGFW